MDLSTQYLGLALKSPLIASASPLTGNIDTLRALEDAGASAAVLPSLFEEHIEHDDFESQRVLETGMDISPEADGYFPVIDFATTGPDAYLRLIENAKASVDIPIIASLNGASPGGWVNYALMMEQAGADALELNVYFVPTDPDVSGAVVEQRYVDLVSSVRERVGIPLAVKVGPYFSSMAHMARQIDDAGADALVLFNRFLYPDIELEDLSVVPKLQLSSSSELRMPLRWIAILREYVQADLAASSGAHGSLDAAKFLLAGADVVMFASCLLQRGPDYLKTLHSGLAEWIEQNEYDSVAQLQGSMSQAHCPNPAEFERANYKKALASFGSDFE
jgi:dihydroorotate dehydrogenase (fumarate)